MERPLLRIVMIEDDGTTVEQVSAMLEEYARFPYQLEVATSLEDGLARIGTHPVDIVLMGLSVPGGSGLDTLDQVRDAAPHVPVIVITGQTRGDWAVQAIQRGAGDYIFKESLEGKPLVRSIRRVMDVKRADDERVEDQNLLYALLGTTMDLIYFKDIDSRFTRVNQALAGHLGLDRPEDATGLTDYDFYERVYADETRADEERIMKTGLPLINKEEHEVRMDGRDVWMSTTKMPLRDPEGRIIGTFGISRDITRRKTAEHALQDVQIFLNSIVENIPNMIFVKDAANLCFVRFNRAGEELLGYSRDDLIGKSDYDFFPKEEADFFTAKDREVLRGGQVVDIPEEIIETRHKGRRILHTVKMPILDTDGRPQYLLGISEDITARKQAEEERARAESKEREIMERTDRLNTIGLLAAGMAHEINNPLQGMLSHMRSIKRRLQGDERAMNSLLMVERGVESISTLVQKLLALGGSSREQRLEKADCGAAIRFVSQLTESQLARAGVALVVKNAEPTVHLAMAEKELIQVLLNLMINARDAMPDGGTLTVASYKQDDSAIITVRDTGQGMSPEVRANIFTPFYTTKGIRGTGLGLVVAASLVHAAGGTIDVDSEPGKGTVFTLRIPLEGSHA